MQDDFDAPVDFVSGLPPLNWTYDKTSGTGTLSQGSKNWTMHGQKDNDLNAGKNLVFSGQNGAIVLKDSVTQGPVISNLKTVTPYLLNPEKPGRVPALLLTRGRM